MKRAFLLILIIGLFCSSNFNLLKSQISIENYSDKNDVYSMHFKNDTMWIGTTGGVVYRVATNFSLYNTLSFDDGLASNYITAITVDNNGTKWFGSFDNGITSYNNGVWNNYNPFSASVNRRVFCLEVDGSGNIWAGTASGAYRFDGTSWTQFNDNATVLGSVRSISVDGSNIWFGTFGNGLYSFDGANWNNITTAEGMSSNNITAIVVRNDSLFIGSASGVSFRNLASVWTNYTVGNNDVLDMEIDAFGTVIAGTSNGLYSFSGSVWNTFPTTFSSNKIAVVELESFYKWVGFNEFGGGVQRSDGTTPIGYIVSSSSDPGKNDISAITSIGNDVYIGTRGRGVSRYSGGIWTIFDAVLPSQNVLSLARQVDTLWIGTDDEIVKYDGVSWTTFTAIDPEINAIAVDQNNLIWCGTPNGVSSLLNGMPTHYMTDDGLLNNKVIAITVDQTNNVWFLHDNGASRYNGTSFTVYNLTDLGLSGAELFDIDADESGGVWIACSLGVLEFNTSVGTSTLYTTVDGLPDNHVISVYVDEQNIKHFGTRNGGIGLLSNVGWQKINRQNGLPTNLISAVYFQSNQSFIWSGGKWGAISRINIPPISVSGTVAPSAVCYGGTVTLSSGVNGGFGSSFYNYSWTSTNTDFTSSSATSTDIPGTTTTYQLQVDDGFNGGSYELPVTVNVVDTSDITGPQIICPDGTTAVYSVVYDANKQYFWNVYGGTISTAQNTERIDIAWDRSSTSWGLSLSETDISNSCTISQDLNIRVDANLIPNIVLKDGNNLLICTDSGMVSYQWFRDEIALENDTNQFYYLDRSAGNVGGAYYVEIESPEKCRLISSIIDVPGGAIKAYPNPAKNTLNLDFNSNELAQGQLVVKDLSGKSIETYPFNKTVESHELKLDLSDYKQGVYSYRIYIGGKIYANGKFIVN